MDQKVNYKGLMLGAMVGDALGLTREGLSASYAQKIFGKNISPNFIIAPFCKRIIICSDDTEHLWLTADALLRAYDKEHSLDVFEYQLSKNLQKWVLSMPIGAGKATLKSCFKLLIGISPKKSGVLSAGNGATMRAPIIAAFFADSPKLMEEFLKSSTIITHNDPRAYDGALVIAKAVVMQINNKSKSIPINHFFDSILNNNVIQDMELTTSLILARKYLQEEFTFQEYIAALKLDKKGITGYINHTVPAVIYAWLFYYDDYQKGIEDIILAGGDTDSTASLLGSLLGLSCINTHKKDMDTYNHWLNSIMDYPINSKRIEQLSRAMETRDLKLCPKFNYIFFLIRNICMLPFVLLHGFRRLIPLKFF